MAIKHFHYNTIYRVATAIEKLIPGLFKATRYFYLC